MYKQFCVYVDIFTDKEAIINHSLYNMTLNILCTYLLSNNGLLQDSKSNCRKAVELYPRHGSLPGVPASPHLSSSLRLASLNESISSVMRSEHKLSYREWDVVPWSKLKTSDSWYQGKRIYCDISLWYFIILGRKQLNYRNLKYMD